MTRRVSWAGSSQDSPALVCACLVLSEACSQVEIQSRPNMPALLSCNSQVCLTTCSLSLLPYKAPDSGFQANVLSRNSRLTAGNTNSCCCRERSSGERSLCLDFICKCPAKTDPSFGDLRNIDWAPSQDPKVSRPPAMFKSAAMLLPHQGKQAVPAAFREGPYHCTDSSHGSRVRWQS
jgi:hypothetical protein